MWHKIYLSEFGGQTWKPKSVDDAALKEEPVEIEDWSAGHWKKMYFRSVAGQELNKWRRELREVSPYTGLPRQTEWILRYNDNLIFNILNRRFCSFLFKVSSTPVFTTKHQILDSFSRQQPWVLFHIETLNFW